MTKILAKLLAWIHHITARWCTDRMCRCFLEGTDIGSEA